MEIPFDEPYLVLLAENGQGKTSILNLIYGVLCNDAKRLSSINFRDLQVSFPDGSDFTIIAEDLEDHDDESPKGGALRYLQGKLSEKEFSYVIAELKIGRDPLQLANEYRRQNRTISTMAFRDAVKELEKISENAKFSTTAHLGEIKSKFACTPLYLPTYRRIEEDFARLGLEESPTKTSGINFGIQDVENKLEEMRKAILTSSNESFSRINGEILSKLINGFRLSQDDIQQVKSLDRLDLVLERIGGHMQVAEKEKMEFLFRTEKLFSENKYEPLVYFLSNMVKVYGQQKKYDVALRDFTEKCNGYLVDQELKYNESAVHVQALNKFTGDRVDLKDMSSGEKQIISLFSKLFLDPVASDYNEPLAVFFDEPELSLSVEWQETLLPDVLSSEKCDFLFAVTHSPFILKNVKQYARDMSEFICRKSIS